MTRKFFRRLLASTLLMISALAVTAGLGAWQYTVAYRNDVVNLVAERSAVGLAEVSDIGEYLAESNYGQAVNVSGVLDCRRPVKIDFFGNRDPWELCQLELQDATALAVVFATAPENFVGEVDLLGRIQPAHSVDAMPARYEAKSTVPAINTDDLVLRWQKNTHDGYVLVTAANPEFDAELLDASLVEWPPVGIQMRNLFYAWQWWIFAAFTIFIWAKFTIDDYRDLIQNRDRIEL